MPSLIIRRARSQFPSSREPQPSIAERGLRTFYVKSKTIHKTVFIKCSCRDASVPMTSPRGCIPEKPLGLSPNV